MDKVGTINKVPLLWDNRKAKGVTSILPRVEANQWRGAIFITPGRSPRETTGRALQDIWEYGETTLRRSVAGEMPSLWAPLNIPLMFHQPGHDDRYAWRGNEMERMTVTHKVITEDNYQFTWWENIVNHCIVRATRRTADGRGKFSTAPI